MNAYIITIGDEILIGQTLNSNAAFIGSRLTDIGLNIIKTTVVADNRKQIIQEFEYAEKISNVVIVTGGLGPTHDDITKSCIVEYFDTELVFNQTALDDAKSIFKNRGIEFSETNREQSLFPRIAELIRNTKGTAPGMWIEKEGKYFISMPGVPYEMKEMMESFVIPKLSKISESTRKSFRVISTLLTTGIPESHLYDALGNLDELLDGISLAFLPSQFGVKLRLTSYAETEEEAKTKVKPLLKEYFMNSSTPFTRCKLELFSKKFTYLFC